MVLIAAMGVGGVSLLIAEAAMRLVIARQELSLLTSAAAFIDNDIDGKRQLLKSLTEQIPGREVTLDEVQAWLEAHGALRDAFFDVTAFDVSGTLIASLRDRRAKGTINIADRQYFQDTVRMREGLISTPFKSQLSGKPVIVITQTLENARGELIAVLVGAIDLQRPSFSAQLDVLRSNGEGYLFIVGSDRTIIHHPNKDLILKPVERDEDSVMDAVLKTPEGWQDNLLDEGELSLVAHKRLRTVDWTIAVSYPTRSVFAPMATVRLRALAAASLLTLLAALFGWALTKALLRPLETLHGHVEDISSGASDIKVFDVVDEDEFGSLSRAFFALSQHRARAEQALHRLATTDALTGINNRRMFDEFFPIALSRASRAGQQVGLAFLDVDHFKRINDEYGHAAGDAVLVEFARRLERTVRCTDTVARLAGDEFVIVFEQLPSNAEVNLLGRKILEAMAAPFLVGGRELLVTTSIGIALTTSMPAAADDVMRAADQALYGVKAAGRNGFAVNHAGAERLLRVRGLP
ncbi:sensor domain-containing diguanylate cyclase [Pseudoduganella namucuonensis]|nr:sensor domain-containing diguanylate cyclase [Pseudoduganella namucuonensis]